MSYVLSCIIIASGVAPMEFDLSRSESVMRSPRHEVCRRPRMHRAASVVEEWLVSGLRRKHRPSRRKYAALIAWQDLASPVHRMTEQVTHPLPGGTGDAPWLFATL